MTEILPRHLREPRDKTSKYYDGRYAQKHPNTYYSDENEISTVLAILDMTQKVLLPWNAHTGILPLTAAESIRVAYEALSDIEHHLPRLNMWCVWTHYTDGWSDTTPVWSAHFSEEVANQWLPLWKEALSSRSDYGWHVSLHECRILDIRDPDVPVPKSLNHLFSR